LPAGSWAVTATANSLVAGYFSCTFGCGDHITDMTCELRNGAAFIGGATDRRLIPEDDTIKRSLSMNGGAQVPAGGGEVSLWCLSQSGGAEVIQYSQIMMIRVGGFS
jgi:hypothetical protein